jgi:UDP-glucose 4-epimerase
VAKIAITGGAGFIGSNLATKLLAKGHKVVVVDDLSSGLISNLSRQEIELREGSITDFIFLSKALADCEHIFHLAARGSVPRSLIDPQRTFQVNSLGTLNVLEASKPLGIPITFSSSSSVYGSNKEIPKNEFSWTSPLTPYGASKLAAESLVLSYSRSYGIPHKVFRFFNVFGPNQRPEHVYSAVIPKWLWLAMNNKLLVVEGDGTQSRDFTYVSDVVQILVDSLSTKIEDDMLVNLAFGVEITLRDVLDQIRQTFPNLQIQYSLPRSGDIKHSRNDPARLSRIFPDFKQTEFSLAISETLNWLADNKKEIENSPSLGD